MQYKIVRDFSVASELNMGWKLYGHPYAVFNSTYNTVEHFQAMVKEN